MSVPDKQKNYPLSAKCYVSMATHLQLLFMKVILFANETGVTIADLGRVDNSHCCDRGSEGGPGAYFSSLKEPPPLHPRSITWTLSSDCYCWNHVRECRGGPACG